MFVARSRLNDAINLLKQNHSELLGTIQDLVDDWVRTDAPKCNRYRRWRIGRNQKALHRAVDAALKEFACLAEPRPDAPPLAEFMGNRYPCLDHTQECWRALRRVKVVMTHFPEDPRLKLVREVLAEVVDSFDAAKPVELRDWPTSANLIADYMALI
jgi:hypothetical protein